MSSISGMGGSAYSSYQNSLSTASQRPKPAEMAEQLFSKLDSKGQGYIEQADLQSALDSLSNKPSASDLFTQLDTDQDGKVTKQEFSDSLEKIGQQLENQVYASRMQGGDRGPQGMGGMPPPPPPPGSEGDGPSLTKDELTEQISAASADDPRTRLMSKIAENFEAADSNQDGKVSFQEATAYDQQDSTSSASASATSATDNSYDRMALQLMRLMEAYGLSDSQQQEGGSISVNA